MFLKIIGSFFIIIASVKIGLSINDKQKRKITAIEEVIEMLETFKIRFEYEQITVLKLIEDFSINGKSLIKNFSSVCLNEIKKGKKFNYAWDSAVSDFSDTSGITLETQNKIKDFASNLGKTALDGQLSIINFYILELKNDLAQEREKLTQSSKINLSCSIFGGLVFVIFLL